MQTRDKVKDLIPKGLFTNDTRMVLANAVYFKGEWATRFDPKLTRREVFTLADGSTVAVPMMRRVGGFRHHLGDGFEVAEVPYKGGELAMVFLVPDKPDGLPALQKRLTPAALAGWLAAAKDAPRMNLALPKFRLDAPADLKPHLNALGMVEAFQDGVADFSGMCPSPPLYVQFVRHKAVVDVNEAGNEAAAATAVGMAQRSARPEFRAARPFVFLIRDTNRGTVLFLGRVEKP